jgi:hypothetical protein
LFSLLLSSLLLIQEISDDKKKAYEVKAEQDTVRYKKEMEVFVSFLLLFVCSLFSGLESDSRHYVQRQISWFVRSFVFLLALCSLLIFLLAPRSEFLFGFLAPPPSFSKTDHRKEEEERKTKGR